MSYFSSKTRQATPEELMWMEEFRRKCPHFGVRWTEDYDPTVLSNYIKSSGALVQCQHLSMTKGWKDHLGCGPTVVWRSTVNMLTEALYQTSWLKGSDVMTISLLSDTKSGVISSRYHLLGLFRLLCSVQGQWASEDCSTYTVKQFNLWYPHKDDFDTQSQCIFDKIGGIKRDPHMRAQDVCQTVSMPNLDRRSQKQRKTTTITIQPKPLTEKSVRQYIAHHFNLQQITSLEKHLAICRLRIQSDKVDSEVSDPDDEVFECPDGWVDCPHPNPKYTDTVIWENEDTGEVVFPCKNVNKAVKYTYNDDITDLVKV